MTENNQTQHQNELATIPAGTVAIPTSIPEQIFGLSFTGGTMNFPPFWGSTREIYNQHGFGPEQLKTGFLSLIGLNSAAWGNPLALTVIDQDGSQAASLMNLCLKMVPDNRVKQVPSIEPRMFLRGRENFKGKAIAGFYNPRSQKTSAELLPVIQRLMQTHNEGPVSWLMITNKSEDLILSSPLIIKLPMVFDSQSLATNSQAILNIGQSRDEEVLKIKIACVRKSLTRMSPRQVEIAFGPQLVSSLNCKIPYFREKIDNLVSLLRNIVIINNPLPITRQDIFFELIDFNSSQSSHNPQPLQATKFDYYHLWVITGGVLPGGGDDLLTPKQQRIFRAILNRNLISLENKFLTDDEKRNEAIILGIISDPHNCRFWADKEGIRQAVNQDGGEMLTVNGLDVEVNGLVKLKIISQQKNPDLHNKYSYYVNMLTINYGDKLPHPSEVIDPVYNGNPVQVVNPLTGQTEQI